MSTTQIPDAAAAAGQSLLPRSGRIAFVSTYLPRPCGIATFTSHLNGAIEQVGAQTLIIPINDPDHQYDYPAPGRFTLDQNDIDSYRRAAQFLNMSHVDVVSLQHEFGIFGGPAGSHVLALLQDLQVPVVTTLHTVPAEPKPEQRDVLIELARLSDRLVVMSRHAVKFLRELYDVPAEQIDLIPHGIPDFPFVDPAFYKDQFGVAGRHVLLTFGLLGPNKGLEYVIQALPEIVARHENVVYLIVGRTHPYWIEREGERYRLTLQRLARELGVDDKVVFFNRFVEDRELMEFLGAADIYITPYLSKDQISSGTLTWAVGAGKAVISTPYWYAQELLDDGRGVLVPFRDAAAIGRAVNELLSDEARRHAMRKRAYLYSRDITWPNVAHRYLKAFARARELRADRPRPRRALPQPEQHRGALPQIVLDHLCVLTDDTGLLRHARYSVPDYSSGYSTDDNARALILMGRLTELGEVRSELIDRLSRRYLAFLLHAFDEGTGRFRNFLRYDRTWAEQIGSEDCHGRALWALGRLAGHAEKRGLQELVGDLFNRALPAADAFESLRAAAFTLLGLDEYLRWFGGDLLAQQLRRRLAHRLLEAYRQSADDGWCWFEETLTYSNARLPQALLVTGHALSDASLVEVGVKTLRWLVDLQRADEGHFVPIGAPGYYRRGGERARFDQLPIEAASTVAATLAAARITGDESWMRDAGCAFEWFLGRNDIGAIVCDPATGACYDGLHPERVNANQGAEATVSYLLALAEMRLADQALRTTGTHHGERRAESGAVAPPPAKPDPQRAGLAVPD